MLILLLALLLAFPGTAGKNNIYNIDKSKTFNIKNNICLNEQYFHKNKRK